MKSYKANISLRCYDLKLGEIDKTTLSDWEIKESKEFAKIHNLRFNVKEMCFQDLYTGKTFSLDMVVGYTIEGQRLLIEDYRALCGNPQLENY